MSTEIIESADDIFRIARWVRGAEDGVNEMTGTGKAFVAFCKRPDGTVITKPMADPPKDIAQKEVSECISILCETKVVDAVLSIGDAIIASDATPTEAATIESLMNLGVEASAIAEGVKCAHYVLSAVLYTKDGILMTYNSPVESCTVFNRMIENGSTKSIEPRKLVQTMSNKTDPFSEDIGDLSVLWWRCRPSGKAPEYEMSAKSMEVLTPCEIEETEWN